LEFGRDLVEDVLGFFKFVLFDSEEQFAGVTGGIFVDTKRNQRVAEDFAGQELRLIGVDWKILKELLVDLQVSLVREDFAHPHNQLLTGLLAHVVIRLDQLWASPELQQELLDETFHSLCLLYLLTNRCLALEPVFFIGWLELVVVW